MYDNYERKITKTQKGINFCSQLNNYPFTIYIKKNLLSQILYCSSTDVTTNHEIAQIF